MNTLTANVMVGNLGPTVERIAARARKAYPVAWNAALVVATPLIGLLYIVAFPLAGLVMLAWAGAGAVGRRATPLGRFAKNLALFVAAPIVGLVYAVALPFVGIGFLAWKGARAIVKRRAAL
jgi:hypothetical protein